MADGKKEARVTDSHLRHLPSFRGRGDGVTFGGVQMWDQIDRRVRKFELTLVRDKREMLRKLGQPIDL